MPRLAFVTLAAALAIGVGTPAAQTNRESGSRLHLATGTVRAVSPSSLTLGSGRNEMTFALDTSTRLITTPTGARKGDLVYREPRLNPVKVGDRVAVTYRRSSNALTAVEVRLTLR